MGKAGQTSVIDIRDVLFNVQSWMHILNVKNKKRSMLKYVKG